MENIMNLQMSWHFLQFYIFLRTATRVYQQSIMLAGCGNYTTDEDFFVMVSVKLANNNMTFFIPYCLKIEIS